MLRITAVGSVFHQCVARMARI